MQEGNISTSGYCDKGRLTNAHVDKKLSFNKIHCILLNPNPNASKQSVNIYSESAPWDHQVFLLLVTWYVFVSITFHIIEVYF